MAGPAHRLRSGLCPRRRRIRIGHLHRGQHADEIGDRAAAHHHQIGAVRLLRRNRHRRRHARSFIRLDAGHQCAAKLGIDPARYRLLMEAPAIAARYEAPASRALRRRGPRQGMRWGRLVLIGVALAFLAAFLLLPLLVVFAQAFSKGVGVYLAAVSEPTARSAIKLTLTVAAIA